MAEFATVRELYTNKDVFVNVNTVQRLESFQQGGRSFYRITFSNGDAMDVTENSVAAITNR